MPLESGSTISQLDSTWPLGGDPTSRGDDHLRLIKSVLKAQFPGVDGQGFKIAITAKEVEINYLGGAKSNIQAQIDALVAKDASLSGSLSAPQNTRMMFFQPSAPAGWTQVTTYNDYMLRIVNTAGGGTGGTMSPVSASFAHTHGTGSVAINTDQMPPHTHLTLRNVSVGNTGRPSAGTATAAVGATGGESNYALMDSNSASADIGISSSVGSGQPHNHGTTDSSNLSFTPRYLNTIIANKN